MIVAPGLHSPTATCEVPSTPDGVMVEPCINNYFRIDVAALTIAAKQCTASLTATQLAHVEEMELELSVLGCGEDGARQAMYLAPSGQCQVLPEGPYKESILTTGVQEDVIDRVERLRSDGTRSATELRARFQAKTKMFSTWKRLHAMVPQHLPGCVFQTTSGLLDADATAPPSPCGPPSPTWQVDPAIAFSPRQGAVDDGPQAARRELMHRPRCLPLHVHYQPYAPNFRAGGMLDDSYFTTAVAAVATNRRLLSSVFVTLEHLARGAATLQFYPAPHREGGEAQFVTIDTLVPVASETRANAAPKDMKLLFGATSEPQDLWLVLLEKAYATFRGSFAALDGGCAVEALVHLTGGSPWSLSLQGPNAAPTPVDDVWWFLMQGTLYGDLMLVYSLPRDGPMPPATADGGDGGASPVAPTQYPTTNVRWQDSLVVVFACEYDSTVEVPQDLYAKLLGKPTKRGDVYRLVKVRQSTRQRREAGKWSWDWSSPKWTALAKQHLAVGEAEGTPETAPDSLSWWATVEELVAHFTTLTACTNHPHNCMQTDIAIMTPAPSVEESALHAPAFSLSISKKGNVAKEPLLTRRASSYHAGQPLPHEFQSIHDVVIPDLDFGQESEDEEDDGSRGGSPMGSSSPRSAMSGSQTFLDSIRSRNAVALEVRLAVPLHLRHKPLQVVLYRVAAHGKKVICSTSVRDGHVVHQLPIHGRLPWTRYASPPCDHGTAALSAEQPVSDGFASMHASCSYFAEADLLEGFYNIVVSVDPAAHSGAASAGEALSSVAGPVLLSVRQRPSPGGTTAFDLQMGVLP